MAVVYQVIPYAIFSQYASFWVEISLIITLTCLKWEVCIYPVLCASDHPCQYGKNV